MGHLTMFSTGIKSVLNILDFLCLSILSVIRNLNNTPFKKSKYSPTFAMVLSDHIDGGDKNLQTNHKILMYSSCLKNSYSISI